MWPFKSNPLKVDQRNEPVVCFIGEQDGGPERELKAELTPLLEARPNLLSAYLSQIAVGSTDSPTAVALAVRADSADLEFVKLVAQLFKSKFRRDAFLDIIFITPVQEAEVAKVCTPFYRKQTSRD